MHQDVLSEFQQMFSKWPEYTGKCQSCLSSIESAYMSISIQAIDCLLGSETIL